MLILFGTTEDRILYCNRDARIVEKKISCCCKAESK